MTEITNIKLNDGVEIPVYGFGTFMIPADGSTKKAVKEALDSGIRHIDSAVAYFNEQEVGQAIHESNIPWEPFAEGKNGIFENEILSVIGKKYGKSLAQVILRWLYERGIVSLVKSVKKDRMKQNIDIFNFSLTSEDKEQIGTLQTSGSQFFDHDDPKTVDFFEKLVKEREI